MEIDQERAKDLQKGMEGMAKALHGLIQAYAEALPKFSVFARLSGKEDGQDDT